MPKDLGPRLSKESKEKPALNLVLKITPTLRALLEERADEEDGLSMSLVTRQALRLYFQDMLPPPIAAPKKAVTA